MIFIMRHGQTDWNAARRMQGKSDIPLNEAGRQMAAASREAIARIPFDICYCSPLSRAKETAQLALAGSGISILEDARLMEIGFGSWEGHIKKEGEITPIDGLFEHPESYIPPEGAESLQQLWDRTGAFFQEIALPLHEQGKNVLIVAHGGTNCCLLARVRQTPVEDYWKALPKNCEIIQLL
ncbi:MAG: histidine phosphatase family protein [Firmicutes bacterium]|nr:histidine phosphatase family protein [Bacillota bacterium]